MYFVKFSVHSDGIHLLFNKRFTYIHTYLLTYLIPSNVFTFVNSSHITSGHARI